VSQVVQDLNMNVDLTKSQLNRGTAKKKKKQPRDESSGAKKALNIDKIDSAFAISK